MSTNPNEKKNAAKTPLFEKFPKPNTIPSGWHTEGLAPNPAPASDAKTDSASPQTEDA